MDKTTIEVLQILVDKAIQTNDGWLVSVELRKAELKKIVRKLESLGCISNVQFNGWNRVQCKVNFDIALSYLE